MRAGAGDWMTAGMLAVTEGADPGGLVAGDLIEAVKFGARLAALNCAYPGARSLIEHHSLDEVLATAAGRRQTTPGMPVLFEPQSKSVDCEACRA